MPLFRHSHKTLFKNMRSALTGMAMVGTFFSATALAESLAQQPLTGLSASTLPLLADARDDDWPRHQEQHREKSKGQFRERRQEPSRERAKGPERHRSPPRQAVKEPPRERHQEPPRKMVREPVRERYQEPYRVQPKERERHRVDDRRFIREEPSRWREHGHDRRHDKPRFLPPPPRDRYFSGPPRHHHPPRDVVIVRPFRYAYPPHIRHHHHDDHIWGLLSFTAITLAVIDLLNDQQQREHEMALYSATSAPLGETIYWREGNASGSVTPIQDGTSSSGRYCREFQHEVEIGSRSESLYGTACQNPDGSWEIVE